MAADNVRQSQQALEHVDQSQAAVNDSQAALEVVHETPPSGPLKATQGALEAVHFPPNAVWASQVCLEVLFPAYTPPTPTSRRNHSFIGVWMGTGHGDNASFNF